MSCITIAEGVERESQEAFLRSIGCEMFQGYYYYHPMEAEQIAELLLAAPLADLSRGMPCSPGMNTEFA